MSFNNMSEVRAIDNLDDMTGIIKNELNNITEGFVAVGYYLKKTAQDELYKQKGYQSLFDYAKENFGISRPTAIRFMEINDTYSIGGFSPEIDERWRGYGSSKLTEMLGLPEEIRETVPAEATVKDLREAKTIIRETESKFSPQMELCDVAQTPEETQDWMKLLAIQVFHEKDTFLKMVDWSRKDIGNDRKGIEEDILAMVNPTKFKALRLEKANVMMQEKSIRVMPYKVNGILPEPEEYTYIDLAMAFEEICFPNYPDVSEPVQKIYERVYGEPLYEQKEEPKKPEKPRKEDKPKKSDQAKEVKKDESGSVHTVEGKELKDDGTSALGSRGETGRPEEIGREEQNGCDRTAEQTVTEPEKEESQGEEIVPAQKSSEHQEILEEDRIPGQTELTKDFPQYCPESVLNQTEEPEREVKSAYGTRRQYLAKLSEEEIGTYLAAVLEKKIRSMKNTSFKIFVDPEFWQNLLTEEVDEEGREIECVN